MDGSGLQPFSPWGMRTQGVVLGWDGGATLALGGAGDLKAQKQNVEYAAVVVPTLSAKGAERMGHPAFDHIGGHPRIIHPRWKSCARVVRQPSGKKPRLDSTDKSATIS